MKFIHAADLHLDSPMRNLDLHTGKSVEALRTATRESLKNIVQLALVEAVDFVVIAGDLFDGQWSDVTTGLWVNKQFSRLNEGGIRVFLLRGNHDAPEVIGRRVKWAENVHEFPADRAETVRLDELRAAVHGRSFAAREAREDLAASYPTAVAGYFNVGVLHTSLGGSAEHETYAPTSLDVLKGKGYDYWALGHIHTVDANEPVCREPFVAWSGNTQGRSIRECGAKGVRLIEVQDGRIVRNEFQATDVVRWCELDVKLADDDTRASVPESVVRALGPVLEAAQGRPLAVRLHIGGDCAAHEELSKWSLQEDTIKEIRFRVGELSEDVWIEQVRFATRPRHNLERLRASPGVVGELLQEMTRLGENETALRTVGDESLAVLLKAAEAELRESGLDARDPAVLRGWLREAEALIVSGLAEDEA